MKFKEVAKKNYKWISLVLFILFSFIVIVRFGDLTFSPFQSDYQFKSVSCIEEGFSGKHYVVDGEKKVFLILDQKGNIEQHYIGGSLKRPFYYVTHACDDGKGNVYISDIVYGEHGNRIQKERILRLTEYDSEVLWEEEFANDTNAPLQYGQILQLDYVDGKLGALFNKKDFLSYQYLDIDTKGKDNRWETEFKYKAAGTVESAEYDPVQELLAVSLRNGRIYLCNKETMILQTVPEYAENQIPVSLAISEDYVYYSDLENLGLYRIDLKTLETEVIEEGECMYPYISYGKISKSLLLTDFECCYMMDEEHGIQEMASAKLLRYHQYVLTWLLLVLDILFVLIFLAGFVVRFVKAILASDKKEYIVRFILVLISCILVGSTIAWSEVRDMKKIQLESQLNNMELFAQMMVLKIDGNDIKEISTPGSYDTETFKKVREPLDHIIDESYKIGQYYYYCIYSLSQDGVFVDGIMDYEDTIAVSTPSDFYEGQAYKTVFEEGKNYKEKGEGSAYGSWMYVDVPIRDDKNEVCGFLEIGSNLDMFNSQMKKTIFENICSAFCNAAVVAMLILEVLFLASFFEYKKKKELSKEYQNVTIPIRAVNFLTYAATGLIDAFVIIMCTNLFRQDGSFLSSVLPAGIGAALPLSSELLFSSLSSLFGGILSERFGTKKIISMGFLIQFLGFAVCAFQLNYAGILIGLSMVGMGMGLVYVGSNTMAAMAGNETAREKGFADVAAGGMSGATVGVGLGSLILSLGTYQTVFFIGAALMIVGFALCLTPNQEETDRGDEVVEEGTEEGKGSFGEALRFLFNRRVFVFFLFLVTPFMMTLSFKDYFFPTYAENAGITEIQIGQIQLLCGMLVLYIGPYLSHVLIEKIGGAKSMILSMLMVIGGMGIFLISPSLITSAIAMGFVYVSHSFAYTCQYFYFDELPAVVRYGEGGAMGIFSMFENIGQTVGPILFGAALMLGFWQGISAVALVLVICLAVFILFGLKKEGGNKK